MASSTDETYIIYIKSGYFLNIIYRRSHMKQCRLPDINFFPAVPKRVLEMLLVGIVFRLSMQKFANSSLRFFWKSSLSFYK